MKNRSLEATTSKRRDFTVFTGGRGIFSEDRPFGQSMGGRFNAESTSIPYIMRSMMFYRAAGGFDEFALHNASQHAMDMSDLLPTRRAMLIGIVDADPKIAGDSVDADSKKAGGATDQRIGSQILRTAGGVEKPIDIAKRTTFIRAVLAVQNDGRNDR